MTEIIKTGKSKDQIKKEHELAEKEDKIRQKEEEIKRNERGMKLFQEWRTKQCVHCETIFNIESFQDIETYYSGTHPKYVKCPNCRNKVWLKDIPDSSYFPPWKPSNLWYLLPLIVGFWGGVIGYAFIRDTDRRMANNLFILGVLRMIIFIILAIIIDGLNL